MAFGARSECLKISNLQSLDSLLVGGPSADWLGVISPAGHGWGLDLGGVLSRADGAWISLSLVDMGRMTWEGESYSVNDIDLDVSSFGSSEVPSTLTIGFRAPLMCWMPTRGFKPANRHAGCQPSVGVGGAGFALRGRWWSRRTSRRATVKPLPMEAGQGGVRRDTHHQCVDCRVRHPARDSDVWRFRIHARQPRERLGNRFQDRRRLLCGKISAGAFASDMLLRYRVGGI